MGCSSKVRNVLSQAVNEAFLISDLSGHNRNLITYAEPVVIGVGQENQDFSKVFKMEKSPDNKTVTWEVLAGAEEVVSSLSHRSYTVSQKNFCKSKHDLISEYFSGDLESDAQWSTIDPTIMDKGTPDIIEKLDDNIWVIIEIGTCVGTGGPALAMYRGKYSKYLPTVEKISESHPDYKFVYWIIIVGPHEIQSTFQMPEQMSRELMARYYVGVNMEDCLIKEGLLEAGLDEEATEIDRILQSSLRRLSKEPMQGRDMMINQESHNNFKTNPVDKAYISESLTHMIEETQKMRKTRQQCLDEMSKAFDKLEQDMQPEGLVKESNKAPCQIPLILANKRSSPRDFSSVHVFKDTSMDPVVDKIWREAYNSRCYNLDRFPSRNLDVEYGKAKLNVKRESDPYQRSKWHRVEVNLTDAEELHLAKDGYHGKKAKTQEFMKVRRSQQQKGFSLSNNVEDIKEALDLIPNQINDSNPYFDRLQGLLEKAEQMSMNSSTSRDVIKAIYDTDLVTALCIISAIGQELAVSLKQHVTKTTWVFKQLDDYEVEMLVSPTNSESHIFFLLRYKGVCLNQGAFRSVKESDGWLYTDLLSINSSRIDNLIKCHAIYVNTLLHFRINVSKMQYEDLLTMSPGGYSEHMAMLCTMMALEDKANTEDMALNVRYLVMQFAKGADPLSWPDVADVILKMPTTLRSRLAVYLYQKIKAYCYSQWESLPRKVVQDLESPDHSPDKFVDLLCPFTGTEVESFYDVCQVIYLAYAKNKNATPEQNCDFHLIKKIAAYVLNTKEDKSDVYAGVCDPAIGQTPGPHEFSHSFLKVACEQLKARLNLQLGSHWAKHVERQIIKELFRATHHEAIATMKASADFQRETALMFKRLEEQEAEGFKRLNNIQIQAATALLRIHRSTQYSALTDEQWADLRAIITLADLQKKNIHGKGRFNRVAKSCKCHEAVIKILETDPDLQPLLIGDLSSIFNAVMRESRGICCYLFKKNQHAGLREIYVLTIKSRLLQLVPEVCARVLCSLCPEEVLTHPEKKTYGYEQHNLNVLRMSGSSSAGEILHRTSSEDKSKWSQGMNVTAFALIFSQLLPDYLAKACHRVFHAFRNKRVLLPEGVKDMFINNIELRDETYMQLKREFWKGNESSVFEQVRGQTFLRTPTGMWQGILHYCSSLLHVLQTIHYKSVARTIFQEANKKLLEEGKNVMGKLVIDTVVSSDDSATYGTVVLPQGFTPQDAARADDMLDLILKLEVVHSSFFMMVESPKSCISSKTVSEFNSIFICARTYISPAIKKVLAACSIPESEDLESRQITFSNMHKDILEEGCSFKQVQLHAIISSILHYTAFGLFINPLFDRWASDLINNPDPHLGFWLLDMEEISGLMGYNFIKYNSLKDSLVAVMPSNPAIIKSGAVGDYNSGVVVTQGDRKRWEQFRDRVVWKDWKSYIEQHPETLFMEKGHTREEIQARLSAKACSKGIHESLKTSVSDCRVVAASVYILDHPVVSISSLNAEDSGVSKEVSKGLHKETLIAITTSLPTADTTHSAMTPELRDVLYPNNRFFDACRDLVLESRSNIVTHTVRHRKVRNHVEVRMSTNMTILPIMQVLRWKWLSQEQKHAVFVLKESWNQYASVFPWLRATLKETLAESPFSTYIDLHSFLSTIDKKSSKVNILSKRLRASNPFEQINELIKFNQYPETMSVTPATSELDPNFKQKLHKNIHAKISAISDHLALLIHAPVDGDISLILSDMTSSVEFSNDELIKLSQNKRFCRQAVVYAAAVDTPKSIMESMLLTSGRGVLKQYLQPQSQNTSGDWSGPGRVLIKTRNVNVEVLVHDKFLIAFKCDSIDGLKQDYGIIADQLLSDGFDFTLNQSVKYYAKSHFKELTHANITPWVCTRRAVVHSGPPRPIPSWRGGYVKQPTTSGLNSFNPIVIQVDGLARAIMTGGFYVKKSSRNNTPYLQVSTSDASGREISLLRYYGPKRPQPGKTLPNLKEDEIDEESLLECWLSNSKLNASAALKILEHIFGTKEIDESRGYILDRTNPDALEWFVRMSFKWRAIGLYKIRVSNFEFASDLPKTEGQEPLDTRHVKEDVQRIIQQLLNDEITIPSMDPHCDMPTNVSQDVYTDWNSLMDEDINLANLASHSPESSSEKESDDSLDSEEVLKSVTTEHIEIPQLDLQLAPGLFMNHSLWDSLIMKLEAKGVWDSINKGYKLGRKNQELSEFINRILELPNRWADSDEEDEE